MLPFILCIQVSSLLPPSPWNSKKKVSDGLTWFSIVSTQSKKKFQTGLRGLNKVDKYGNVSSPVEGGGDIFHRIISPSF